MSYEEERAREQARQREFDEQVEKYLERLSRVHSLADLLTVFRDAAGWALAEHRKDMERKYKK
jgi:hypothetical protein